MAEGLVEAPTTFVGREAEVAALSDVVDAAVAGRGSLTLICGEPGIGKTALAEECARTAAGQSVLVRWATCWEGDGQRPYWPWVQAMRAETTDTRAGLRGPNAVAGQDPVALLLGPVPAGDPETARFELFDTLARRMLAAAAETPRLLVLDDLQWADASSLQFLLFLARRLRQAPLAVVATCRDVDVDPASPMLEVFPDLCRLARVLTLAGLDDGEMEDLLRGVRPDGDPQLVAELLRQSGGNPLFASELARLGPERPSERGVGPERPSERGVGPERPSERGVGPHSLAAGGEVPLGLRQVIGRRLERFDGPTLAVLQAAAVLGPRVDVGELARAAGRTESDVLDLLGGPISARLVGLVGSPAAIAFAHDLVRRTLYDGLAPGLRADLHRRAADAIAATMGGDGERAGRLAAHRVEAAVLGERGEAIAACRLAAGHAARALAHEEAAAYLRTAARLAGVDPATGPPDRASLYVDLAEAEWRAGRPELSVAAAQRALAEARLSSDPVTFARAALACCAGSAIFDARPDLVALLDEARQGLVEQGREEALVARLLARQSILLVSVRPVDQEAVAKQAVDAARRAGDDVALAEALQSRHQAIWTGGRTTERAAIAGELAEIASRTGSRDLAVEAALMRFVVALDTGDGEEVDHRLAEVSALAEESRRPLWRFYAATRRAAVATARGAHADAQRAIEEAEAVAPEGWAEAGTVLNGIRARLAVQQGRNTPALTETSLAFYQRAPGTWNPGAQAAYGFFLLGEHDRARRLADRLLDELGSDLAQRFPVLAGAVLLTEVCVGLDMDTHLPALYRVLSPHQGDVGTVAGGVYAVGPVAHALGRLAAAQGQPEKAVAHFQVALDVAARMRSPAWGAWTSVALAEVLAVSGDAARAAALRAEARDVAERLGLPLVLAALGAPAPAPSAPAATEGELRMEGDDWRIALGPESVRLRDAKGLRYLAELVAHPGTERHALDLVAVTEGAPTEAGMDRRRLGDAGALLDPAAKAAYRRRLEDLREDVAEAEAFNDGERAARAQAEIDALVQELSRAVGLGGRDRRAASAAERARLNVTRALRAAIARVDAALPPLGAHLDRSVRTGLFCVYEPEADLHVRVTR